MLPSTVGTTFIFIFQYFIAPYCGNHLVVADHVTRHLSRDHVVQENLGYIIFMLSDELHIISYELHISGQFCTFFSNSVSPASVSTSSAGSWKRTLVFFSSRHFQLQVVKKSAQIVSGNLAECKNVVVPLWLCHRATVRSVGQCKQAVGEILRGNTSKQQKKNQINSRSLLGGNLWKTTTGKGLKILGNKNNTRRLPLQKPRWWEQRQWMVLVQREFLRVLPLPQSLQVGSLLRKKSWFRLIW